ncbi:DUF4238 domain-containing protein [Spirosoma utsteinense]|uniref:DUF4238 domain-containing protein n=1 Tax=Spirosoma utsteinense TaxID=2585773 RepID=UPI00164502D2|nr:DUF4238 domain-containing protein [Spirosoma utsteinense]MBC3788999.1 hypothetical protein [Spirosoma utsteinense]
MSKLSKKHHYLPEFYIKGFTNTSNHLYVYNKRKDIISKRPLAPGGIFYEIDANTIEWMGEKNSELEDIHYRQIDDNFSKLITIFRFEEDVNSLFTPENKIALSLFFISLFWRIPVTERLAMHLIKNTTLSFNRETNNPYLSAIENKGYKDDPSFLKVARAAMFFETVKQLSESSDELAYYRKIDFPQRTLLLGDFPMLYEKLPMNFDDLYLLDYIFPISSTRIITRTRKELKPMTIDSQIPINLSIIHQSTTYVTSTNYDFLKCMVEYYQGLSVLGELDANLQNTFNYKI